MRAIVPRTGSDLATLAILAIATFQVREPLLLLPLATATLFLSAYARILGTELEQVALISYGVAKRQLIVTQYSRGLMISSMGILPVQLILNILSTREAPSLDMLSPLDLTGSAIIAAAMSYTIPFMNRLRTGHFIGLLKN